VASLLDLLDSLLRDPMVKASYDADPGRFLSDHGWGDLDDHDLSEALVHVANAEPPGVALHLDPVAGLSSLAEFDPATAEDPYMELGSDDDAASGDDGGELDSFDPARDFAPDSTADDAEYHGTDGHRQGGTDQAVDEGDHRGNDGHHADTEPDLEDGHSPELPAHDHDSDGGSDGGSDGDVAHFDGTNSHDSPEHDGLGYHEPIDSHDAHDGSYSTGLFDEDDDNLDADDAGVALGDDFDFD
jgi:hypothetical protein